MDTERHHIVINPNAGGGRTRDERDAILRALEAGLGPAEAVCIALSPEEAESHTRQALRSGAGLVIAVGGDGTFQSVVRGFFEGTAPVHPGAVLGLVSTGTGCGFAQSIGIDGPLPKQIAVLRGGGVTAIDVGCLTPVNGQAHRLAADTDTARPELFINECQFGIGGTVVRRVHGPIKRLGGKLAFGVGTLLTSLTQRPHMFYLALDDAAPLRLPLLGLVVANGPLTGGGMRLVPGAVATDGCLDVLLIHAMSVPQRLRGMPRIYHGTHVDQCHFSQRRCRRLVVRTEDFVDVGADGEPLCCGARTVTVLPGAISILCPAGVAS